MNAQACRNGIPPFGHSQVRLNSYIAKHGTPWYTLVQDACSVPHHTTPHHTTPLTSQHTHKVHVSGLTALYSKGEGAVSCLTFGSSNRAVGRSPL